MSDSDFAELYVCPAEVVYYSKNMGRGIFEGSIALYCEFMFSADGAPEDFDEIFGFEGCITAGFALFTDESDVAFMGKHFEVDKEFLDDNYFNDLGINQEELVKYIESFHLDDVLCRYTDKAVILSIPDKNASEDLNFVKGSGERCKWGFERVPVEEEPFKTIKAFLKAGRE